MPYSMMVASVMFYVHISVLKVLPASKLVSILPPLSLGTSPSPPSGSVTLLLWRKQARFTPGSVALQGEGHLCSQQAQGSVMEPSSAGNAGLEAHRGTAEPPSWTSRDSRKSPTSHCACACA